jgi:hypothetical protein
VGELGPQHEFVGKDKQMIAVVVRARFGARTLDSKNVWKVQKGDVGVIKWHRHTRYHRFLEPRVIWDLDPSHKARRTIMSSIAIVGLQTGTTRVMLAPWRT